MYKQGFAERMKKARQRSGYTQKEVEQETGISQSIIAYIESGKREPSIENLGILIDLYEIDANWILGTGTYKKDTYTYGG
jgi:toxin-antitoxin system, antitoxin component, xre family